MFCDMLQSAMEDKELDIYGLSDLSGIGVSSLAGYINGRVIPPIANQQRIARALGLTSGYFAKCNYDVVLPKGINQPNLSVFSAARLMGKNVSFIRKGLQQKVFPFGYAVKVYKNKWEYYISPVKFAEYTGCVIVGPDDLESTDD